jgi:hypothetical protein
MRTFLAFLLLIGAVAGAPAHARPSADSRLLGSWAVDVSRLPMPPQARPKGVTITFSDAGQGKLAMEVDIVDAGGTRIHSSSIATLDGSGVRVDGSPEADLAAMTLPQPHVLVVALGKDGIPASTRVYAAAADGGTMVETAVYFGRDGQPIMRTNYFTRAR